MDIEDRIEIADLLARFALYVDCADAKGVSSLFTDDGSYESIRQAQGRESLAKLFEILFADRKAAKRVKNPIHLCGWPVLSIEGDTASAWMHFIYVVTSNDAPEIPIGTPLTLRHGFEAGQPGVFLAGMYKDSLRKIDGQWYIARRQVLVDLPGPSEIPHP